MRSIARNIAAVTLALGLVPLQGLGQDPSTGQLPDAPSATRPANSPFPANTAPAPAIPARPEPAADSSATPDTSGGPSSVRPASAGIEGAEDLPTLITNVNFVQVPVTVKDRDGHLVEGLLRKDFSIYEDGVPQPIKLFTSDPFPLSVAIVVDAALPDLAIRKVNETLPALAGAFSQFDEVGLYVYANTVTRRLDYSAADQRLSSALKRTKVDIGRQGGVPVNTGPMAGGPSINGKPADPSQPHISPARHESAVLNDAILAAANDLARRDRTRRKIVFVISDGYEFGSQASYSDVLKVLLSNNISVYTVSVEAGAIPGYSNLSKIHIPRMGYGDILPKYSSATGGEIFTEFSRDSIEAAYSRVTEVARNQYTLGYTTRSTAASNYRQIEIKVHKPNLLVFAKDGYYPLPVPKP